MFIFLALVKKIESLPTEMVLEETSSGTPEIGQLLQKLDEITGKFLPSGCNNGQQGGETTVEYGRFHLFY